MTAAAGPATMLSMPTHSTAASTEVSRFALLAKAEPRSADTGPFGDRPKIRRYRLVRQTGTREAGAPYAHLSRTYD
jgi:hypothetical protein